MLGISQRYGFAEYLVANERAQGPANHDLHAPPQKSLKVAYETSRKPRGRVAGYINQKIYIAVGQVLPPGHRAEQTNIARAVPCGNRQNLVAVHAYSLADAHSTIIVSQVMQG